MFNNKKMEELKEFKDSIVKNADQTVGSALNKAIDYKKERDAKKEAEEERLKQEQAEQFRKTKEFLVKYKKILIPLVVLGISGSYFSIYWADTHGDDGYRHVSKDINYYLSKPYEKVVDDFKLSGFDNIVLKEINQDKGVSDIETNDVVDISIDSVSGISTEAKYKKDAKVEVSYYVQPKKKEEPKQEVIEEKIEDVKVESEDKKIEQEVIHEGNNSEFAKILKLKNEFDPSIAMFANREKGKEIFFDGCIIYSTKHGGSGNRYDVLLSYGDYVSPDHANSGPIFKFDNVTLSEMGIPSTFTDSYIKEGTNVRVSAFIDNYNSDSGLFLLRPNIIIVR